jgi:hypothetical protein
LVCDYKNRNYIRRLYHSSEKSKGIKNKLKNILIKLLKQGTAPERLALCIVLGIDIGLIPLIGVTTALCALLAVVLRLNMPLIQLVNYAVFPLQIVLIVPFFKLGELFFNRSYIPFSAKELVGMFREDWWGTFADFWMADLMAILAWLIVMTPLSFVMYYITLKIIRGIARARKIRNV